MAIGDIKKIGRSPLISLGEKTLMNGQVAEIFVQMVSVDNGPAGLTMAGPLTVRNEVKINNDSITGNNNGIIQKVDSVDGKGVFRLLFNNTVGFPPIMSAFRGVSNNLDYIEVAGRVKIQDAINSNEAYSAGQAATALATKQNTITNSDGITQGTTNLFLTTDERTKLVSVSGTLFVQTANSAAVANTAVATTILGAGVGSLILPASFFVVGKTIRIKWHAIYSTTGTPTLIITPRLGATSVATSPTVTLPSSVSSLGAWGEIIITCRTVGGSGTVRVQNVFNWNTGLNTSSAASTSSGNVTIDTTVSQTVGLLATWNTASASNTITGAICTVENLN